MCGIFAINKETISPIDIIDSLDSISHRGPDNTDYFNTKDYKTYLGHTRLSIIDLDIRANQPMVDHSGRFILVYNGEIYNYQKLKKELDLKYNIPWKTRSDSEVIIEGFAFEGVAFLEKLNGIFAIVLYDTQTKEMFVLRDPIGVKPIYYTSQKGTFFCSEIKGLLAIKDLTFSLRFESIADQLAFMYIPEPNTIYNEIFKLPAGFLFTFKDGKKINEIRLFKNLDINFAKSKNILSAGEFDTELSNAIDRQLIGDVPMSLMLSGGIDSSVIASKAIKLNAKLTNAFTVAFSNYDLQNDGQSDDLLFAKIVADKLNIKLNILEANKNYLSLIPDIIRFTEGEITDPSALNTYLISKFAAQSGVKVLLSGQGADELLGGYRRYIAANIMKSMPILVLRAIGILKYIPQIDGLGNAFIRRVKRFAEISSNYSSTNLFKMYSWSSKNTIDNILNKKIEWNGKRIFEELFDTYSDLELIEAMMKVDFEYDLKSLNLLYTDKMSMANGIEVRVPFLDFEFIKFVNKIDLRHKVNFMSGKYILKKSAKKYLPNKIVNRSKSGFGLPIRSWIKEENDKILNNFKNSDSLFNSIFNVRYIEQIMTENIQNKSDHSNLIFTILMQKNFISYFQKL